MKQSFISVKSETDQAIREGKPVYFSNGGFDFLEEYLCKIYGDIRGKYAYNLQRYYMGDEFQQNGRKVSCLEDMQDVTWENLRFMVDRERFFHGLACEIVEKYDKAKADGTLTDDDNLAIAGIMGIYGGQVDWSDTLYPHVANLFVDSNEMAQDL